MILPRSFYARETVTVARELLGKYLVHETDDGLTVGKIVETEAYLGAQDAAAHSFKGKTPRTEALFGPAGTWYVYSIYGLHACANLVTGQSQRGEAVLIRALEPVAGLETMQRRRGLPITSPLLTNGPAKLVQAMGILLSENGSSAVRPPLYVADSWENQLVDSNPSIVSTSRVGISLAVELPLRFYLPDSPFISRK